MSDTATSWAAGDVIDSAAVQLLPPGSVIASETDRCRSRILARGYRSTRAEDDHTWTEMGHPDPLAGPDFASYLDQAAAAGVDAWRILQLPPTAKEPS